MEKTDKILFGIEIEAEMNLRKMFGEEIQRSGLADKYYNWAEEWKENPEWKIGSDGSLRLMKFREGSTIELRSKPFLLEELPQILSTLKKMFKGINFSEVLNINTSCGSHIHFSGLKNQKGNIKKIQWNYVDNTDDMKTAIINDYMGTRLILTKTMARNIRKRVKQVLTEPMLNRYNRKWSRPKAINYEYHENSKSTKYIEFRKVEGGHYEYRSPSFVGIQTWGELATQYAKVLTIMQEELTKLTPEKTSKNVYYVLDGEDRDEKIKVKENEWNETLKETSENRKEKVMMNLEKDTLFVEKEELEDRIIEKDYSEYLYIDEVIGFIDVFYQKKVKEINETIKIKTEVE